MSSVTIAPGTLKDITYVMDRLGLSRPSVERLVDTGALPYIDVATHVISNAKAQRRTRQHRVLRFLVEDVEAFIASRRVQAPAAPAATEPSPAVARPRARRQPAAVLSMEGAKRYA